MIAPRKLLAIVVTVSGVAGSCGLGGNDSSPPAAAPLVEESTAAEPTTTTTDGPLLVEVPRPAIADLLDNPLESLLGNPLDLLDDPLDSLGEFPQPEAGADGAGTPTPETFGFDAITDLAGPDAETEQVEGVAADPDVAVRRAVAANPATPPEVLVALDGDTDPGVRWLAAANPSLGPETRTFPEQDDRLSVAGNPAPWPDVLATLTADIPARQWAAANPQTPAAALLALAGDLEADVAVWVGSNPNAPAAALVLLTESRDPLACRAVSENPSTPPALLARIAGFALAARADPATSRTGCHTAGALPGVARNPSSWPETLARLAADEDVTVRRLVAGNPATPPPALDTLATDMEFLVRLAAAGNPATPPDALARLLADDDLGVRWEAATNPSTPPNALAQLAADPEALDRRAPPADPLPLPDPPDQAEAAALVALTENGDPQVCLATSEDPSTRPALLARIAGFALAGRAGLFDVDRTGCQTAGALLGVAQNPSSGPQTLHRLADDEDVAVRRLVAGNPATPPDTLAWLLADDDLAVRWEAATNLSTPPDALAQLAADPEALDRRAPLLAPLPEQALPPAQNEDEPAQGEDETDAPEGPPEEDTTTQ